MQPIPESTEAVEEFGPFTADGDLLESLQAMADSVRKFVPDCVGLSVAAVHDGVSFTLVATDAEIAALDAVQYLTSGPCVEGVRAHRVIEYKPDQDTDDELGWQLFARATSAASIASTLTLPILNNATVVGSVNLYGASANAFTGHHEAISRIFDAWASGAVTNADLSSRRVALPNVHRRFSRSSTRSRSQPASSRVSRTSTSRRPASTCETQLDEQPSRSSSSPRPSSLSTSDSALASHYRSAGFGGCTGRPPDPSPRKGSNPTAGER